MKITNKFLSIGLIVLVVIFFATAVIYNVYEFEVIPSPLFGALMGVFITALVTAFLLRGQTEGEAQKEKNTKKFEKKLEIYHSFLDKLNGFITQNIEEKDLKDLIFQIAKVRMHTKADNVEELFKEISNIVENITKNKGGGKDTINKEDEADSLNKLTKHIMSVITILQNELYGTEDKMGELDPEKYEESIKKLVKSFTMVLDSIETSAVSVNINEKIDDIKQITKRFEETLESALKQKYSHLKFSLGGKEEPSFVITSDEWGKDKNGKDFSITLYYDGYKNIQSVIISIHGANGDDFEEYRSVYRNMKAKFGCRFNSGNWFKELKEPYNKWVYTDEGVEKYKNMDKEMLDYFCKLLSEYIEYYNIFNMTLQLKYRLIEELENKNEKLNKDNLEVWFYNNNYLVHEYKLNNNEPNIVIDTYIDDKNDQWKIDFFDRKEDANKIANLFPEVLIKYNVDKVQENKRYLLKTYDLNTDLSKIAGDLMKIRELVEKKL